MGKLLTNATTVIGYGGVTLATIVMAGTLGTYFVDGGGVSS